jgi:opacity protein-like surface antigen
MKNFKITIIAFAALFFGTSSVQAQAVEQGNILVDVYAGYGSLYNAVFRAFVTDTENDAKFKSIDAIGIRGEYMVADKFGVGLDICYSGATLTDPYVTSVYNSTTDTYSNVVYEETYKTRKIGVMATMNYHFLDNDKVDLYGTFGVGYKNRKTTFENSNPDPFYVVPTFNSLVPIAMRIGAGVRYFFTDNIGLNLGLGVGQGGFINGGISAKF